MNKKKKNHYPVKAWNGVRLEIKDPFGTRKVQRKGKKIANVLCLVLR